MREEYHGITYGDGSRTYQQLYGWGTISANIWLPSVSELVGFDLNTYNATTGVYYSAMQGINLSIGVEGQHVVMEGGSQFAYFKAYNASGGGAAIMQACNQDRVWTRSSVYATEQDTWRTTNAQRFDWGIATGFHTVHPAVLRRVHSEVT